MWKSASLLLKRCRSGERISCVALGCFPSTLVSSGVKGLSVRSRQGQVHIAQRSPPNPTPPSAAEGDLSSPEGGSSMQPKKVKKKKKKGTHTESLRLVTGEQMRRATATRGTEEPAAALSGRSLRKVALVTAERKAIRQRYFSSAVLSSTSNILSDIQEYTYLQMKGISYAIDFRVGSALCGKSM